MVIEEMDEVASVIKRHRVLSKVAFVHRGVMVKDISTPEVDLDWCDKSRAPCLIIA